MVPGLLLTLGLWLGTLAGRFAQGVRITNGVFAGSRAWDVLDNNKHTTRFCRCLRFLGNSFCDLRQPKFKLRTGRLR
jgi:hypothetical protein